MADESQVWKSKDGFRLVRVDAGRLLTLVQKEGHILTGTGLVWREASPEERQQVLEEAALDPGADWMKPYQTGAVLITDEERQTLEWIRSRPSSVQALMRQFPPSCKVQAGRGRTLVCPAPGRIGVVASYIEDGGFEDGGLSVQDEAVWLGLEIGVRADCEPGWLVVVSYLGNMTPDWVDRVLAGEDIAPIWED